MADEKRCAACGEVKPLSRFFTSKRHEDGYRPECRSCVLRAGGYRPQRRPVEPVSGATKRCTSCGEIRPLEAFYRATGTRDGRRGDCRECFQRKAHDRQQADPERRRAAQDRMNRWRAENPELAADLKRRTKESGSYQRSLRKTHLKTKYGITPDDYDRLLADQGGGCLLCGEPPRDDIALHVDHDHDTGRVRGLLCFRCNAGLGQFRHDPELLHRAATYVGAHRRVEELVVAGLEQRLDDPAHDRSEHDSLRRELRARLDALAPIVRDRHAP